MTESAIDAYIAAQPEPARATLERVRATLRKALPDAEEIISYKIPAYRVSEGVVIYFAGWKEHFSLYPVSSAMVETLAGEIAPFEASPYATGKATLRFPLSGRAPLALIRRIAKLRLAEVRARKQRRKHDAKRGV